MQLIAVNQQRVAAVIDALVDRGFLYAKTTESDWTVMTGALITLSGRYPCKLLFPNSLLAIPYIRLLEHPKGMEKAAPHIESNGMFCYADRDAVTFDYFDAPNQVLAYLERAEEVLQDIIAGQYDAALQDDFFAYWRPGTGSCYDDRQSRQVAPTDVFLIESPVRSKLIVTDDQQRTLAKLTRAGWKKPEPLLFKNEIIRVSTDVNPRPWDKVWPIITFEDFLNWQTSLDKKCGYWFEKKFKQAYAKKVRTFHFVIDAPRYSYGMQLILDEKGKQSYAEVLESAVVSIPITPMGEAYMAERNTPNRKTLTGLRIVMAGCGTIGGFLAELLIKAGAGTLGGELVLIDDETLIPGNVGRHRLGFDSVELNKAKALAAELGRNAPGAVLTGEDTKVEETELGQFDLLIDATGEETLGHWLAEIYASQATQLSVWIEGPGVAVRSLLRVDSTGGCRRCLCDYRRAGEYTSTKEALPTTKAGHGCEHLYVPFPATVSVQAACLATEAIIDWVNGITTPNLRTRLTDASYTQATRDCQMPRRDGCPACQK